MFDDSGLFIPKDISEVGKMSALLDSLDKEKIENRRRNYALEFADDEKMDKQLENKEFLATGVARPELKIV